MLDKLTWIIQNSICMKSTKGCFEKGIPFFIKNEILNTNCPTRLPERAGTQ